MRGMNSNCVDLIYLDPPFNSKANYAAPIGSMAAGAEFKDTWTLSDVDIAWLDLIEAKHPALNRVIHAALSKSDKSYLIYMAVRLLEMKRILKPSGSIYLHCDPTMSHYLKLVMDAVFGRKNFRNEIVWCYAGPSNTKRWFPRKHDVILFYVKSDEALFNEVKIAHKSGIHNDGTMFGKTEADSGSDMRQREKEGKPVEDWWNDIGSGAHIPSRERVGYPTQKPVKLLDRILQASSNYGDVVLDPFCGCATTCVAAENLGRQWVGIDISEKAAELVKRRISKELGVLLFKPVHRFDVLERTDLGNIPKYNCKENKTKLYGEQGGHCNGCGEHFKTQNLTVDHITPKSKGGTDHLANLQLLCGYCNSVKGDRGQEYLLAKLSA